MSRACLLVFAAWVEDGEDHQIGIREQPFLGLSSRSFGRASQGTEVTIAGQASHVFQANPGEADYFLFRKDLLAGLDSHHFHSRHSSDACDHTNDSQIPLQ